MAESRIQVFYNIVVLTFGKIFAWLQILGGRFADQSIHEQ